ncbi:MAG: phosphatase PAP2 family protein [Comamonadaceae bacterium]|nr:MAG: phosphatase PAP2 family protein [Comamonadaceae bacterium]
MLLASIAAGLVCRWLQRRAAGRAARATADAPPDPPRLLLGLAIGFGSIVLAAAGFAFIALQLRGDGVLGRFDDALTEAIGTHLPRGGLELFALLTHLGDVGVLVTLSVLIAALLWRAGRRALALGWSLSVAGNGLLNPVLKRIFERARPVHDHGLAFETGFSFPSGHSSGSMVVYGMLFYLGLRLLPARWHPLLAAAATALVVTTASSRIFLQVHFASDVAAGLLSGLAWLAVCITSIEWARHRRRRTAAAAARSA